METLRPSVTLFCNNQGDQKAETAAVAELAAVIKGDNQELGEKVEQLQKQDKNFRDLQAQQVRVRTVARDSVSQAPHHLPSPGMVIMHL